LLLSHDKSKGAADLLEACENGKTHLAQLMLEGGADMNARTSEGGTPLMIAAAKGNLELVEALLAKGADATAQDNKGFTALAWAYSPTAMNVTPFKVQREIIRLLKHHEAPKPGVAAGRE
jgi:ankyrin repeat protein